jgi:hypothetical protein
MQSSEAPYFYADPRLVSDFFELDKVALDRPPSYERGSNPRALFRLGASSHSRSSEADCPDHAPTFAARAQILGDRDAARYAGMRSLRALGVNWQDIVRRNDSFAWVGVWAETCERESFCVCSGFDAGRREGDSSLSSNSSGALWAPSTEQMRSQLMWHSLVDSSSMALFDRDASRLAALEASIEDTRNAAQAMARFRRHGSQVVITVDLEIDRFSTEAQQSAGGYRILVGGVPWGTLNMREGIVYRLKCSEAKLRSNLGFWVESRAMAYRSDQVRIVPVGKTGERGVTVRSSANSLFHLDVTVVDRSRVLEHEDDELCFGLASQIKRFGSVRLVDADYSGDPVSGAERRNHTVAVASSSSAERRWTPVGRDVSALEDYSESDEEEFTREIEGDALADHRPKMFHVGIVFLYTPLRAGAALAPKVYSKTMPLSSARVRDKTWYFSPMGADPTLGECVDKVTASNGARPSTSTLKLHANTYYRFALVLDPECGNVPLDELQCPELCVFKDERALAKLPNISQAADVRWSDMFVVSDDDEDEEGTLPLPVTLRTSATDDNSVVFRVIRA